MYRTMVFFPVCLIICTAIFLTGCPQRSGTEASPPVETPPPTEATPATLSAEAQAVLDRVKTITGAEYKLDAAAGKLLSVRIPDGSQLTEGDITLFATATELEGLQIEHFRDLNDAMAAQLKSLVNLKKLGITDCIINDATVSMIAETFPNVVELDLSSNTLLTNASLAAISKMPQLERLTLIQCAFNDIGMMSLGKLKNLIVLDIRGCMGISDMETVAELPKLRAFRHRSTAVMDGGIEALSKSASLETLEVQDFTINDMSGPYFQAIPKLTRLDIFRCEGFGSEGVLALAGKPLIRLKLRGLPSLNDTGAAVLKDLPTLRQLILHEVPSVTDAGLKDIDTLKNLELIDFWIVSSGDETVKRIAQLPNVKSLSLRETEITDASIDLILSMPKLEELTIKDNLNITPEGLKKLSGKKFKKLVTGGEGASGE